MWVLREENSEVRVEKARMKEVLIWSRCSHSEDPRCNGTWLSVVCPIAEAV